MTQKLIVIRGNSGSGKSTIAQKIRNLLPGKVMVIEQDVLRREILKPDDKEGHPVVGLVKKLVLHGKNHGYDVILEGILSKKRYGKTIIYLSEKFDKSYIYYLDISFEETLRRHSSREKANDFGEPEMREWWLDKDYLNVTNERIFDEKLSSDEIVDIIMNDIKD